MWAMRRGREQECPEDIVDKYGEITEWRKGRRRAISELWLTWEKEYQGERMWVMRLEGGRNG